MQYLEIIKLQFEKERHTFLCTLELFTDIVHELFLKNVWLPRFSFWISITLVKIYLSCIIINRGKNTFELVSTVLNLTRLRQKKIVRKSKSVQCRDSFRLFRAWFVQLIHLLFKIHFFPCERVPLRNLPKCPPATIAFKSSGLPPPNLQRKRENDRVSEDRRWCTFKRMHKQTPKTNNSLLIVFPVLTKGSENQP